MKNMTFYFMLQLQVSAVRRKLKDWMEPLMEIKEEIHVFDNDNEICLVAEDGLRIHFDKDYVSALRKTFKNAEWYLSQPSKNGPNQKLLVGVMPKSHFILLAPRSVSEMRDEK